MNWCNASVVDWDAVGALGTWAVGLAAVYLAFQANRLATALKESQSGKDQRSARAMVLGLRLEVLNYGLRLKRLGETLQSRAIPAGNQAEHAAVAFEAMQSLKFTDFGHRVAVLPHLPSELAERITFLYAQEQTSRVTFEVSARLMKRIHEGAPDHDLTPVIRQAVTETTRIADGAFDLLAKLTDYLGLPPGRDYRNERVEAGVP